jgi:hypothetical protein
MARMPGPVSLLALLMLLSCSGCASWRERREAGADYTGLTTNPYDNGNLGVGQTLSNASVNDWNFRGMFR